MKTKLLSLLAALLLLTSCHDCLNKQISLPLSTEDLKEAIEDYPDFEEYYNETKQWRDKFFQNDVNLAKYGSITYRELYDFSQDTIFLFEIKDKLTNEYEKQLNKYKPKADSLVNYWREYAKIHPNTYDVPYEIAGYGGIDCRSYMLADSCIGECKCKPIPHPNYLEYVISEHIDKSFRNNLNDIYYNLLSEKYKLIADFYKALQEEK